MKFLKGYSIFIISLNIMVISLVMIAYEFDLLRPILIALGLNNSLALFLLFNVLLPIIAATGVTSVIVIALYIPMLIALASKKHLSLKKVMLIVYLVFAIYGIIMNGIGLGTLISVVFVYLPPILYLCLYIKNYDPNKIEESVSNEIANDDDDDDD